eukprot:scaffold206682_cov31-Tisochrysis_lutea.AAC.4
MEVPCPLMPNIVDAGLWHPRQQRMQKRNGHDPRDAPYKPLAALGGYQRPTSGSVMLLRHCFR